MSLFRRRPSVTLPTMPYPAGRAHDVDVLTATLRHRGVELEGRAADRRIIYAEREADVEAMAAQFFRVRMAGGWTPDLGNRERLDCDDLVTLFQAWAVMCLAKHPPREHGGHGVMRLTIHYGATTWGHTFDGPIPPRTIHQVALIAMPADPMVVDVECSQAIRLSDLQRITGNPRMLAKW